MLADTVARDLLALYPQSALAHQIRGNVALRSGRRSDALASFDRALELIRNRQDAFFLEQASQAEVVGTIQTIERARGSGGSAR